MSTQLEENQEDTFDTCESEPDTDREFDNSKSTGMAPPFPRMPKEPMGKKRPMASVIDSLLRSNHLGIHMSLTSC
jgi:hypothetical protein